MSDTRDHYERLLAPLYTWMTGGEDGLASSRRTLDALGIDDGQGAEALDLGAGSGLPSIALGERGWRVTAVDASPTLAAELRARAAGLPITVVVGDLVEAVEAAAGVALITCIGDTLTHLASADEVARVIAQAGRALLPGGRLLLTWRDLTTLPTGDARFFVVRSDPERILTCFLEEVDADHVRVHDLVHQPRGDGFGLQTSSYLKLRLAPEWIDAQLAAAGLTIAYADTTRGLVTRLARTPG